MPEIVIVWAVENMKISHVFLGIEDHGIPAISIQLRADGTGIGYGCFDLRAYSFAPLLERLLTVAGVDELSKVDGVYVRVVLDNNGRGPVRKIGHIVSDVWLDMVSDTSLHVKKEK